LIPLLAGATGARAARAQAPSPQAQAVRNQPPRDAGAAPAPAGEPRREETQTGTAVAPVPDATTPKGALKILAAALRDGDADKIRQVMHATNPSEVRMVASMADMARAMAQLQKAAVKAFGEEGAKEIVGDTRATDAEGRARIDAADVKVTGDTATVTVPDGEDAPVVLKRVGGLWKVPMSELSKNADPAALDERLAELSEQRKLVAELTDEISGGQFTSATAAKDAWQSRAMQAVTRRPPARRPPAERSKPAGESPTPAGDASARPASGR